MGRAGLAAVALVLVTGPARAQEVGPAAPAPPAKASALLPAQDMTPYGMFMNADAVVKAVMVGLALASVLTWTIWLAKGIELAVAKRRLRRALAALDAAPSLQRAGRDLDGHGGEAASLVEAAEAELALSEGMSREGIKERVASRFERIEAAANRRMTRGTGTLATIGSTAPFVGLFGTVWGIMNAFVGIARVQTSNLAVVAPGIAEALLATATGLVAAIPAVVIYNVFARGILGHRALVTDAAAAVLRLVGRDLDGAPRRLTAAAE